MSISLIERTVVLCEVDFVVISAAFRCSRLAGSEGALGVGRPGAAADAVAAGGGGGGVDDIGKHAPNLHSPAPLLSCCPTFSTGTTLPPCSTATALRRDWLSYPK